MRFINENLPLIIALVALILVGFCAYQYYQRQGKLPWSKPVITSLSRKQPDDSIVVTKRERFTGKVLLEYLQKYRRIKIAFEDVRSRAWIRVLDNNRLYIIVFSVNPNHPLARPRYIDYDCTLHEFMSIAYERVQNKRVGYRYITVVTEHLTQLQRVHIYADTDPQPEIW